ncbi:MAG: phosphate ABC transporter permease subunit PstC [Clostridia bacterium]
MKSSPKYINAREGVMKGVFLLSAVFSIFALVAITVFLFASGAPFIARIGIGKFLFGTTWAPLATSPSYGILSMIVATLYVTALAVLLGVGVGLFSAICLYKFCPKKLVAPIRQMVNLLAGIPSVIFGLFGLSVIVPFIRDYLSPNGVGYGILSASVVLGIMILPTIVSVSLDAMKSVPESYYEGALALGATKEQATFKVMLPSAKSGIFAGVTLAIGRAVGETMAVIMVIGGSPEMPNSIFQSVRTLTANIAMGATELSGDALSALIASGVVLFVFTLLLNMSFAALKNGKKEKKEKHSKNKNSQEKSDNMVGKSQKLNTGRTNGDETNNMQAVEGLENVAKDVTRKGGNLSKEIANAKD